MFTGLVKALGTVKETAAFGGGRRFRIDIGNLAANAAIGQSIAINGACLSITALAGPEAWFDATTETVNRTNLGLLRPGAKVNLEPALKAGEALDGHIMLGHVDAQAAIIAQNTQSADNRILTIALPDKIKHLVAEKGSVAIDGISLTVATAQDDRFTVAIIPITWQDTTLALKNAGDIVNLEADVLARYAARIMRFQNTPPAPADGVSEQLLLENGFI